MESICEIFETCALDFEHKDAKKPQFDEYFYSVINRILEYIIRRRGAKYKITYGDFNIYLFESEFDDLDLITKEQLNAWIMYGTMYTDAFLTKSELETILSGDQEEADKIRDRLFPINKS